jgi:tellurite resistance protein TerC
MFAEILSPEAIHVLTEAIPVIISLIIIEGLLSVDNALAIAAMASHLPGKQKFWALRVGIIGAYVFRGLALLFATFIMANPWLKALGAAYLLHLMAHHFAHVDRKAKEAESGVKIANKGFWATVASIELMDLSLGVDNVVAAVALSDQFWVVCTGVFIGILALRFVAGYCIKLIEKFPVLEHTAFLLIGFVGALLLTELTFHVDIKTWMKFVGIVSIIALTIWYSKTPGLVAGFKPILNLLMMPIRLYEAVVGTLLDILLFPFKALFKLFKLPEPSDAVEDAPEKLHAAMEAEKRQKGGDA